MQGECAMGKAGRSWPLVSEGLRAAYQYFERCPAKAALPISADLCADSGLDRHISLPDVIHALLLLSLRVWLYAVSERWPTVGYVTHWLLHRPCKHIRAE
jgi:hypothetical protein